MIRDLVSFIKAVEQIAAWDVSNLLTEQDGTSVLTSSCAEFYSNASDDQAALLQEVEGTADEHLFTPRGLICDYSQKKLAQKQMEIVKVTINNNPVYGLKIKDFVILLCQN